MKKSITAAIIIGVVIIIGVTLYFTVFKKRNLGGGGSVGGSGGGLGGGSGVGSGGGGGSGVKCAIINTNYGGGDYGIPIIISGSGIDNKVVKCQQQCVEDEKCTHWSFHPDNSTCYKHEFINTIEDELGVVSGPKVCPN